MNRFLGLRLVGLFFLSCVSFSAQEYRPIDVFTENFNHWINIQNHKPPGTIDAHEATIWKAVEKAWSRVDREVRAYYE